VPLESQTPGSASDWLRRARSDLALAGAPVPVGVLYEDLCFHAQQAAEKAENREFRYTHDLSELMDGLEGFGITVPDEVREAAELTEFAWQARYPGPAEPVAEAEYHRAVTLAARVVEWAGKLVEKPLASAQEE
jgi:HEPN domain-containing protein